MTLIVAILTLVISCMALPKERILAIVKIIKIYLYDTEGEVFKYYSSRIKNFNKPELEGQFIQAVQKFLSSNEPTWFAVYLTELRNVTVDNDKIKFNKYFLIVWQIRKSKEEKFICQECEALWYDVKSTFEIIINQFNEVNIPGTNYVDRDNIKLRQDITTYEPYVDYWTKADNWILDQLTKRVRKIRNIKNNRELNILDVGCGDGKIISVIAQKDDNIHIIEPDAERLEKAISLLRTMQCENVTSNESGVEGIDLLPNNYDIIICSHVIQHIHTKHCVSILSKLHNALKKDGELFLLFSMSYTNQDEYVVHGLEFNITKIPLDEYESKYESIKTILNKYYPQIGFNIDCVKINNKWTDIINPNSKLSQLTIAAREDCTFIYERETHEGLICSIENKECNLENLYNKFSEEIKALTNITDDINYSPTHFSTHWIVNEHQKYFHASLIDDNIILHSEIIHIPIRPEISTAMSFMTIPSVFERALKYKKSQLQLIKDKTVASKWDIQNKKTSKIIGYIYKTHNYYSVVECNCDMYKDYKIKNDSIYINNRCLQIFDYETSEGFWGIINNKKVLFIRKDLDWYRVFRRSSSIDMNQLLPIINSYTNLYLNEDVVSETIIHDKIWVIKQRGKPNKIVLPIYVIIRLGNEDFFVYRDKKYNRISEHMFNELCQDSLYKYKILPTHRFAFDNMTNILNGCDFNIKRIFFYHFEYNPNIIDHILLREKIINIFPKKNKYIAQCTLSRDTFWILSK